jgi:GNAT superfamily N-acetyltransferase
MGQLGRLVELGTADLPAIQALFERCTAFFELVHGGPPQPDAAERYLRDVPSPARPPGAKTVFGLRDDEERLVGAVDVVRDHPVPGEFWLGTMVIEPTIRGLGLGASLHTEVIRRIRGQGGGAVQLSVQRENVGAVRFWARLGYLEIGTAWIRSGTREYEAVTMRLPL